MSAALQVAQHRFIYFSYCLVTAQRSTAVEPGLPQDPTIYVTNDNLFRPAARVPNDSFLLVSSVGNICGVFVSCLCVTSTSVLGPFNVEPPRIIYFTPIEVHIRYVKPALLAIYDMANTTWKNALFAVCKEKSGSLYHRTQQHNCLCGANKPRKKS